MTESDASIDSLSRSGALAAIDVSAELDDDRIVLDVTYQFTERGIVDGKPLLLDFSHAPGVFDAVEVDGGGALDLGADDPWPRGTRAAKLIADSGWQGVTLRMRITWQAARTGGPPPFLNLPLNLPVVKTGVPVGELREPMPQFSIRGDRGIDACVCGGIAREASWSVGDQPLRASSIVLAHPRSTVRCESISRANDDPHHRVSFTPDVVVTSTESERTDFARFCALSLNAFEVLFGVRISARIVGVHETLGDGHVGLAPASILLFCGSPRQAGDERRLSRFALRQALAFSWWGTGACFAGPHAHAAHLAVARASAFLLTQSVSETRLDLSAIQRSSYAPNGLAAEMFQAFLSDTPRLPTAFRLFTSACWGHYIPDYEFVAWCTDHGIVVPRELMRTRGGGGAGSGS